MLDCCLPVLESLYPSARERLKLLKSSSSSIACIALVSCVQDIDGPPNEMIIEGHAEVAAAKLVVGTAQDVVTRATSHTSATSRRRGRHLQVTAGEALKLEGRRTRRPRT